ncbi:hypothetical protein PINS_up021316, partial [Pythium insidiosum]
LPGLLQRAVLWDGGLRVRRSPAGLVAASGRLNGRTMADNRRPQGRLQERLPRADVRTTRTNMSWYKSVECQGDTILQVGRAASRGTCATANSDLSMWATAATRARSPR